MKFRTGGQTGVDQDPLDALNKYRHEVGGWCPKGRIAEDGIIPERYSLQELDSEPYADRTLANVRDSDASSYAEGSKILERFLGCQAIN